MNLTDKVKILRPVNLTAAGNDDSVNGTGVDLQGYDGVMFIGICGTLTDGVVKLKAQQSADDADADAYADLADSLTDTGVVAANDSNLLIVDVYRPAERYVRPVVVREGGSTGGVIDAVIAVLYHARNVPVTQDATLIDEVIKLATPAEGTA